MLKNWSRGLLEYEVVIYSCNFTRSLPEVIFADILEERGNILEGIRRYIGTSKEIKKIHYSEEQKNESEKEYSYWECRKPQQQSKVSQTFFLSIENQHTD